MTTKLIDQPHFNTTTNFSLIVANLFPIYAVLFLDWEVGSIIIFYCIETFIIGLFNACKMLICESNLSGLGLTLFFLFHYNMFVGIQFLFIASYFASPEKIVEEEEININELISYTQESVDYLFVGIIAIIISHGHSLFTNFYMGKEYVGKVADDFIFRPYGRIVLQQLIAIFGGAIILGFGSPMPLLIFLVVVKTIADLISHNLSHNEDRHWDI